jgi:GDPmannose 4,6-dehydratase
MAELTWSGEGVNEIATDQYDRVLVRVSERYFRPAEVETLLGDASKAKEKLGWQLETSFDELVAEMCASDKWSDHEVMVRKKS